MSTPVNLIPMYCTRCQSPLSAKTNEVAWVCANCGQGLVIDTARGLQPLEIHYSAGIPAGGSGNPYWVSQGRVQVKRSVFKALLGGSKDADAAAFWSQPRFFFIPAMEMPLEQVVEMGMRLLRQPPGLNSGAAVPFAPVTVPPEDARPLAEFVVVGIEADRKDMLKQLDFKLELQPPQLWIFP
jgi:predicted RNA-binding Zn-ribbon protein involved in translation (DUF1610 family)